MREARGAGGDRVEAQNLVAAIRMGDAHGRTARAIGMTRDALMRDVEIFAVAVEQLPQRLGIGVAWASA